MMKQKLLALDELIGKNNIKFIVKLYKCMDVIYIDNLGRKDSLTLSLDGFEMLETMSTHTFEELWGLI